MTAIARLRPHWLRLRTRFTVFVLAGVGLISLAMALLTYHGSSQALLAARQEHLMAFAKSQAWELARSLGQVSGTARNLSTTLEVWHPADSDEALAMLRHQLKEAPKVYGMALAYAPFAFDSRKRFYAPYIYRSPQGFKELNLDSPTYDYLAQDWFLIPNQLQMPNWAEPYFDEGGGEVLMTTYSAPMVKNGQVLGVATADVDLERLGREVAGLAVGQRGYAFLITKQGTFLAAPEESWVMRETFFSLAEGLQRPDMRALGQRMVRGSSGLVRVADWRSGRPAWLAFVPVPGPGWSLGVMAPEDEVLAPVVSLARQQTLWALGGLAALVLVVWWMVVRLTEPLHHLVAAARRLAGGDLSTHVEDVRPGDEVGDLAQSFNVMVDDLKRYVQELVNAQIIPDNEMCMFVTVFYGVYGIKTGQLRYVSAGHPSPLLRRASGPVEQLPRAQGLALGIMDDLRLEMGRINLEVGDTLLVFTDGLDEAINQDNQMYGLGRVGQWLAQALPNDAPQMLDDLIADWRGFTGPVEQFDDLTLLLFRRRE
ncbi:MAG: SpoIIE family protein phosphatase [Desulfarculus sp.]|nr:SpoIIE family protein phosphatase [Desulfarculus sp.]